MTDGHIDHNTPLTPEQRAARDAMVARWDAEDRQAMLAKVRSDAWKADLIVNAKGAPLPHLANALTALRRAPEWQDVLQFDEFALSTKVRHAPPWESGVLAPRDWAGRDDSLTADWLQRQGINVSTTIAAEAVEVVAKDNTVHPVRDYLSEAVLNWDGSPRVQNWLSQYLGAEASPYNAHVGQNFVIGAVARIFQPGCKVDTMPILDGAQGIGKSKAARILAGEWFSDELADLSSKDASLQVAGAWIIEIAELDAMQRAESTKLKAFLSRRNDRFRPPYGKRVVEVPRHSVFIGSTNADVYLKDETGARRFWPVTVGTIDHNKLEHDRDQLWGEAVKLFQANTPWWITSKEAASAAKEQQDQRYVGDPWDEAIAKFLETRNQTSVKEILQDVLQLALADRGQLQQNRVAKSLRSLGWTRQQYRLNGKQDYRYIRPDVTGPTDDGL